MEKRHKKKKNSKKIQKKMEVNEQIGPFHNFCLSSLHSSTPERKKERKNQNKEGTRKIRTE